MDTLDLTINDDMQASDDWGDFDAVINQLEQQEQTEAEALEPETEQVDSSKVEAAGDLLHALFGISEKAISHISEVEFTFDEKDKSEVVEASKPVLEMHGDGLLRMFGDYMPYATLLIAIIALIYSSKKRLAELQAVKLLEHGGSDGKETATAKAA